MMKYEVVPKHRWDPIAEDIHKRVFSEDRLASMNRFDFAIYVHENDKPFGYVTCRETDDKTVYISYGGVIPEARGTTSALDKS